MKNSNHRHYCDITGNPDGYCCDAECGVPCPSCPDESHQTPVQIMDKPEMKIISAIRTLREVRNISYQEARTLAIDHFIRTGLPVPESIMCLHERFD